MNRGEWCPREQALELLFKHFAEFPPPKKDTIFQNSEGWAAIKTVIHREPCVKAIVLQFNSWSVAQTALRASLTHHNCVMSALQLHYKILWCIKRRMNPSRTWYSERPVNLVDTCIVIFLWEWNQMKQLEMLRVPADAGFFFFFSFLGNLKEQSGMPAIMNHVLHSTLGHSKCLSALQ